jgi:hypothetical protein
MSWIAALALLLGAGATTPPKLCETLSGPQPCVMAGPEDRNRYGVPSAEQVAADGGQMVRVWVRGGFGEGLGVVTYRRMPMHEPELIASTTGNSGPHQAENVIPVSLWDRVVTMAKDFDRPLAAAPGSPPMPPCLHPATFVIEAVDAARSGEKPAIRTAREVACPAGPVSHLGEVLIDMAPEQIPACALLTGWHSEPLFQLGACTALDGDRQAAAQARTIAGELDLRHPERLRNLLDQRVQVRWLDEPIVEGDDAAWQLLSTKFALERWIIPQRWIGETADRVRVEGRFNAVDSDEHFTMIWSRRNGYDFRLVSMIVERTRKP